MTEPSRTPARDSRSDAHQGRSQALTIAAVVAAAVAAGSVILAVITLTGGSGTAPDTSTNAGATAVQSPSTTTPPLTIALPSPPTTAVQTTVAPSAEELLQRLALDAGASAVTQVVTDNCGVDHAMLVAANQATLLEWNDGSWLDRSDRLDVEEFVAVDVRAFDTTLDGLADFIVTFGDDAMGRGFGGIFASSGCLWDWKQIWDDNDTYRFIDALGADSTGSLIASGFAGGNGRTDVYVSYNPASGVFETSPMYQDVPVQPSAPVVVSTYCIPGSGSGPLARSARIVYVWSDGTETSRGINNYNCP